MAGSMQCRSYRTGEDARRPPVCNGVGWSGSVRFVRVWSVRLARAWPVSSGPARPHLARSCLPRRGGSCCTWARSRRSCSTPAQIPPESCAEVQHQQRICAQVQHGRPSQCDTNRADGLRGPHRHASPVRRHAWSVRLHAGSHLMCPCATCARSHVGLWTTAGSVHTERAAGPCGRGRPYRHGHGGKR